MKTMMAALLLGALLVTPATASGPVTGTFRAPVERVWTATLVALLIQDWGVDASDRTIGVILTSSHRVQGDAIGPWARSTRLRLRIRLVPLDSGRTTVAVEREVFRRERVWWMIHDEPIAMVDPALGGELERFLLSAIAQAL